MQSSANTALVGLIVIVSALLLSAALLVLGGQGFQFFAGKKYFVIARFDDVTGIDRGMAVTAKGRRVGAVDKIVEDEGRISSGPIEVKLRIDKRVALRKDARAVVTQPEFLGDQIIELEGLAGPNEPAEIKEGEFIAGENGGGIAQLVSAKVNETAEELHTKLDMVMGQAMITVNSVNQLLASMNDMMTTNKVAITGTMTNVQAASKNMVALSASLAQASNAVAQLASDPRNRETLQGLSANLLEASNNLKTMSGSMNALISDPQVNADAKESLALTRETLKNVNASIAALQPTVGKVNTLLDTTNTTVKAVGDVAAGVSGIVGGVSDAVGGDGKGKAKGKAGIGKIGENIHVRFDMDTKVIDSDDNLSYSGDDKRTRDIGATLGYGDIFAEFGYSNIGLNNGGLNFLIGNGNPNKGFSYKTGAYRGEVGTGASYRWDKNAGIDGYMYDTNDPKYNLYGKVPVGRNYSVVAGLEDVTGESQVTAGVGVSY